ncbi:MAG: MBL fold metallo-hydrolase [Pseudomonadota bacterium]|nr:MBL fold metallo-hydrolase [Pseudomonadota bacterium]
MGSKTRTSASRGAGSPEITGFYEPDTGSIQYVLADPATGRCALIDVVLNFDPKACRTSTVSAQQILDFVKKRGLTVDWILDTHPHADHFMAGAWLKEKLGAPQAIGEKVRDIAILWRKLYNKPDAFDADRQFDRLLADAETFDVGTIPVRVMLSPGHTLGSITFVAGDAAMVHDTLMYPDSGSSRCDFPGGSAHDLFASIQNILALPEETRLFVGHDYCKGGREPMWEASVAEHKASNIHVKSGTSEADYVKVREARDATLALPDRMLHALQVNLRGGRLPEAEDDGNSYLKLPLNRF